MMVMPATGISDKTEFAQNIFRFYSLYTIRITIFLS